MKRILEVGKVNRYTNPVLSDDIGEVVKTDQAKLNWGKVGHIESLSRGLKVDVLDLSTISPLCISSHFIPGAFQRVTSVS